MTRQAKNGQGKRLGIDIYHQLQPPEDVKATIVCIDETRQNIRQEDNTIQDKTGQDKDRTRLSTDKDEDERTHKTQCKKTPRSKKRNSFLMLFLADE